MTLRSAHWLILTGSFFIVLAIFLQIHPPSILLKEQLKPLDSLTIQMLYNPGANSIAGNPQGNITLVEFFDYNCKFCRKLSPIIANLAKLNPNLRIVYKEFLLFGEPSKMATAAALAANNQGQYLALQAAFLHANHPLTQAYILKIAASLGLNTTQLLKDMQSFAIQDQIAQNTNLAATIGIDGAPVIILSKTNVLNTKGQGHMPQYIFKGSIQNAQKTLQTWIDVLNKDLAS